MSFVNASPDYLAAAGSDLANIGSNIGLANSAALGPISSVPAAGADEVSASIAALFDAHAQAYQALSAQAASFHQQFVQLMSGGATQYASTEAANASPLQSIHQGVLSEISSPSQALSTGSSLIGSAAPAGSVATGVPAAAAGLAGGSAPASAVPAALAPASTPVAAVHAVSPAGSAAHASAGTTDRDPGEYLGRHRLSVAATPTETQAYSPATAVPEAPAPAGTPVAAVEAEPAAVAPAAGLPAAIPAPASASVAGAAAYRPATPAYSPYSPATSGAAGSPEE
jgi:PE family